MVQTVRFLKRLVEWEDKFNVAIFESVIQFLDTGRGFCLIAGTHIKVDEAKEEKKEEESSF